MVLKSSHWPCCWRAHSYCYTYFFICYFFFFQDLQRDPWVRCEWAPKRSMNCQTGETFQCFSGPYAKGLTLVCCLKWSLFLEGIRVKFVPDRQSKCFFTRLALRGHEWALATKPHGGRHLPVTWIADHACQLKYSWLKTWQKFAAIAKLWRLQGLDDKYTNIQASCSWNGNGSGCLSVLKLQTAQKHI
jgi:hypothetical protein